MDRGCPAPEANRTHLDKIHMSGKRRLLLIDSSDSARTILFKEISAAAPDLDIIACGSGKEAMTAVKRFEFEIITTGISLPDTDGYALIEQIRQTPKNKDTAIFVVSGDTNTRVVGAGMDDTDAGCEGKEDGGDDWLHDGGSAGMGKDDSGSNPGGGG